MAFYSSALRTIYRYALTLAALLLLVVFFLLTLLPLQIVRDHLTDTAYLQGLMIWGILSFVFFIPAVSMLIRKIWFFPGQGAPVSETILREKMLASNDRDIPVRTWKKGKALIVQWRYDDPKWCELMEISGVKRLLEMRLYLDEQTHTITVRDRFRKVNLELCPVKVKSSFVAIPGVVLLVPPPSPKDTDPFASRLPVDYTFRPRELKALVTSCILSQGWNIRYTLL